jgi:hypothetical protein
VILSNKASELGELLAAVRAPDADSLAEDRKELKEYLLGPDEPTSIQQFNTAVGNLAAKSETRNVGQERAAASGDGASPPSAEAHLSADPTVG